jgi:mRNA interferase MazF
VKRGDVCWYTFQHPDKRRPVLILTRDSAIRINSVTVAPIKSTIHNIPTSRSIGDGRFAPDFCAANFDNLQTVPKKHQRSHCPSADCENESRGDRHRLRIGIRRGLIPARRYAHRLPAMLPEIGAAHFYSLCIRRSGNAVLCGVWVPSATWVQLAQGTQNARLAANRGHGYNSHMEKATVSKLKDNLSVPHKYMPAMQWSSMTATCQSRDWSASGRLAAALIGSLCLRARAHAPTVSPLSPARLRAALANALPQDARVLEALRDDRDQDR